MTTAKEAHDLAAKLFEKQSKKQMIEYVGEWNTLLCFLEDKIREEKAKEGTQ